MPDSERHLEVLYAIRDLGLDEPAPSGLRRGVWETLQREIEREARTGRRGGGVRRRPSLGSVVLVFSALVTAVIVAIVVGLNGRGSGHAGAQGRVKLELVYKAEPTSQVPVVGPAAIARAVEVIRSRIASLLPGAPSARVTSKGRLIFVNVRASTEASLRQLEVLLGVSARLEFYDWEANVLTPSGKFVASGLQTSDPASFKISSGSGSSTGPGGPGGGSLSLYEAVKLAAKQAPYISKTNARLGPEYFLFGESGSAACAGAARAVHATPLLAEPCYLAGPTSTASRLTSQLTGGVSSAQATHANTQTLKVNQGWVVMEAAAETYGDSPPLANPTAQFYVMRDNVALSGNDITNPAQSTDATGAPDVTFGFTSNGASQFQTLTQAIAKRGSLVSGPGRKLFQHFAIALETQLITVPYIDYTANPFGIPRHTGADIQGGFTTGSARTLAKELSLQELPVNLRQISTKP